MWVLRPQACPCLAPGDLRKFPKNYRKFPDILCVNIVSLSCWDQFRVLDVFQDLVGHSGRMYLQNVDCLLRRVLSFTIQWYNYMSNDFDVSDSRLFCEQIIDDFFAQRKAKHDKQQSLVASLKKVRMQRDHVIQARTTEYK